MQCEVIAECCQNHNGSREILKKMIHEAKESGATYAKIQALRSEELTFRKQFEKGFVDNDGIVKVIKRPFHLEKQRLKKLDLTDDDEFWFVEECRRVGIKSMITIFARFSAERLCAAGFDAVKVASYDCKSVSLLKEVSAKFKTVLLSTGATFDSEISEAASLFTKNQVSFLHCVTIYPTPLNEIHLNRMDWLRQFSERVGFSDHTSPSKTGIKASQLAIALGANFLERHFTVLKPEETRDGPVSINSGQLRELCEFARLPKQERVEMISRLWPDWRIGLGERTRNLSSIELLNRDYYSGRVAAWVDGEQVTNE